MKSVTITFNSCRFCPHFSDVHIWTRTYGECGLLDKEIDENCFPKPPMDQILPECPLNENGQNFIKKTDWPETDTESPEKN